MNYKMAAVEPDDWQKLYVVDVKCPYCNKRIKIVKSDSYDRKERLKCDECFETFYLITRTKMQGD